MSDLLHCICHLSSHPRAARRVCRSLGCRQRRALSVSAWNGWAKKEEAREIPGQDGLYCVVPRSVALTALGTKPRCPAPLTHQKRQGP